MPPYPLAVTRPAIATILAGDTLNLPPEDVAAKEQGLAKLMGALNGTPSSLNLLSLKATEALGQSLGWKTRKSAERTLPFAYAIVVRALALVLYDLRYGLTTCFDTPRGGYIESKLPIDWISLGGSLQFDIVDLDMQGTKIVGNSEIKGQSFDFGKSKRALSDIFDKTAQFAQRLTG